MQSFCQQLRHKGYDPGDDSLKMFAHSDTLGKSTVVAVQPAKPDRSRSFDSPPVLGTPPMRRSSSSMKTQQEQELAQYRWFVGAMDRAGAEQMLESWPLGAFLVRKGLNAFVFSVRYDRADSPDPGFFHLQVIDTDGSYRVSEKEAFASISDLVHHYTQNSRTFFEGLHTAKPWQGELLCPCSMAEEVMDDEEEETGEVVDLL